MFRQNWVSEINSLLLPGSFAQLTATNIRLFMQQHIVGLALWHLKYGSEMNDLFLLIRAQAVVSCSLLAIFVSSSHGFCALCI